MRKLPITFRVFVAVALMYAATRPVSLLAQTPISLSDPWNAGVTQITASISTTGSPGPLASVSVPANTPCSANATAAVLDTTGGIGGYVTLVCSGGVFNTSATINSAGSTYTGGTSFLSVGKALWIKLNDHTHPNFDNTTTGPPACALTCMYACAGHSVIALTPKINGSGYTFATPSISCSTVQANATPGSCPAYTGSSYTVQSITNGTTTSVVMLDTTIPLSTDPTAMTPILFSSVTGGTISPTIMGLSSLNSGGNADGSWYAGDVIHDNGSGHTTFNVYYQKYDNAGNWSFVKVPTNNAITAPGSIILGGCSSSFPGTVGNSVSVVPGFEDILTSTTGPPSTIGYHHGTLFNVSGSPITSTTSWLSEVNQWLSNPATADGSVFTFSHPHYTLGAQSSSWPANAITAVGQLVNKFPGRIHMQVLDGQLGLGVPGATYGAAEYDWDLLNSASNSPIWGNASDDSYTTTTTGVGKAYTWVNVDSVTTANVMDAYTSGRFYFTRGLTAAPRCGHTNLTIVCNNYSAEPPTASATRVWIWIGEGGKILQVDLNVARSKYIVTGKEGKYVRVTTTTNGSWGGSSVAQTQAYVVGNLYGEGINWFYPNGNNSQTWGQLWWINYGGNKNINQISR